MFSSFFFFYLYDSKKKINFLNNNFFFLTVNLINTNLTKKIILNKPPLLFFFFKNFFENIIGKNLTFRIINLNTNLKNNKYFIDWIFKRTQFAFIRVHKLFYYSEFVDIIIICFKLKTLNFFSIWLKKFFEKIHFKFHKNFLKQLNFFFKRFFLKFCKKFKIKGFLLDVRGKVSVSGNSKKRHYLIKYGCLSKSKKNLRFFHEQNEINTITGVLGITYILTY